MKPETVEAFPCSTCGLHTEVEEGFPYFSIECCGVRVSAYTRKRAVSAWNDLSESRMHQMAATAAVTHG